MGAGPIHSVLDIDDRYHGIADTPYFHPCDESERSRLDSLQNVFRSVYGGNVMVPITAEPTLIIDVGTGSGYLPIGTNFELNRCLANPSRR